MSTKSTAYQAFSPETDPQIVITRSVEVPAHIERVWRAVSDTDEIAKWFPDVSAQWQLEPGGHGIFVWSGHDPITIRVEVIREPTLIAWSWGHETDQEPTTLVEFALSESRSDDGSGAGARTTVTVTESGIRTPAHFAENSQGWDTELGQLVEYLCSRP
jgi:uncharacterized protein YndB with AHSA1/START domain